MPFSSSSSSKSFRPRTGARAAAAPSGPKGPVVVIDNYDSFTYNLCQVSSEVEESGKDRVNLFEVIDLIQAVLLFFFLLLCWMNPRPLASH